MAPPRRRSVPAGNRGLPPRTHSLAAARRSLCVRFMACLPRSSARPLARRRRPRTGTRYPRDLGSGVRIPEPNPSPEPQAQEAPAQGRDSIPAGGGGDAGRRDRPRRRRYDPVDEQGIEPAARPAARARRRPAGVELHSPSELHRLARYRRVRRADSHHVAGARRAPAPHPDRPLRRQPAVDDRA